MPGAAEDGLGLSGYADRLPSAAAQAIASEAGRPRVMVVGHSVGGTFGAIFASLRPDLVNANLIRPVSQTLYVRFPLSFTSSRMTPAVCGLTRRAPH